MLCRTVNQTIPPAASRSRCSTGTASAPTTSTSLTGELPDDVTQPARYDGECQMIHPQAERIKHLTFNGKPVDPQATFRSRPTIALTAANSPAPVRAISPSPHRMKPFGAWLARNRRRKARSIRRRITTGVWRRSTATRRWIFVLRPRGDKAAAFIRKRSIQCAVATDDIGFAIYQLDLSK